MDMVDSMEWKYPLKICLVGDDNHQFFTEINSLLLAMQYKNLKAAVVQTGHSQCHSESDSVTKMSF